MERIVMAVEPGFESVAVLVAVRVPTVCVPNVIGPGGVRTAVETTPVPLSVACCMPEPALSLMAMAAAAGAVADGAKLTVIAQLPPGTRAVGQLVVSPNWLLSAPVTPIALIRSGPEPGLV